MEIFKMKIGNIEERYFLFFFFIIACITYFLGLGTDIIYPDQSIFAEVSKYSFQSKELLHLYYMENDWIDKPHLPFWLTQISYSIFGVNNFGYKIPGLILSILGIVYTYKYTREFINKEAALYAIIILLTCNHFFSLNDDVRAEAYIIGFEMVSFYYSRFFISSQKKRHLIISAFALACCIMTKGIFGAVPVLSAFFFFSLFEKKLYWKKIQNMIFLGGLSLILTFPVIFAYWLQFDRYEDKEIFFGLTSRPISSAIKFFLFDSNFGRLINTGPSVKSGEGNILYHFGNFLIVFFPWALLFYIACYTKGKNIFRKLVKNTSEEETYSFFAFAPLFIILSISNYQLIHHTQVLLPFASIILAEFIGKRNKSIFFFIQAPFILLCFIFPIYLQYISDFVFNYFYWLIYLASFAASLYIVRHFCYIKKAMYLSGISFLCVALFFNMIAFPKIYKYHLGIQASEYIKKNRFTEESILSLDISPFYRSVDFYLPYPTKKISGVKEIQLQMKKECHFYVITSQQGLENINKSSIKHNTLHSFRALGRKSLRSIDKIINTKTRNSRLHSYYFLEFHMCEPI